MRQYDVSDPFNRSSWARCISAASFARRRIRPNPSKALAGGPQMLNGAAMGSALFHQLALSRWDDQFYPRCEELDGEARRRGRRAMAFDKNSIWSARPRIACIKSACRAGCLVGLVLLFVNRSRAGDQTMTQTQPTSATSTKATSLQGTLLEACFVPDAVSAAWIGERTQTAVLRLVPCV